MGAALPVVMQLSPCGRFLVLDALHVDRDVMMTFAAWATLNRLTIQDAVQLALVVFTDAVLLQEAEAVRDPSVSPS